MAKTATTALQQQYFMTCKNLNVITQNNPNFLKFTQDICRKDPIYFNKRETLSHIKQFIDDNKTTLISNEAFSMLSWGGVTVPSLDYRSNVLTNLKSVFNDARILIVIRRQDAVVKSMYRQYLKSGGTCSATRFFCGLPYSQPPIFSPDYFRYRLYINKLHESFNGRVDILVFEEMIKDKELFFSKLSDVLGVQNPDIELAFMNSTKFGAMGLELTRIMNHFFQSGLNPDGLIPGIRRKGKLGWNRISPVTFLHEKWPFNGKISNSSKIHAISNDILQAASDDNKDLDRQYDLNLKNYGYY